MHHRRPRWFQSVTAFLLLLALSACSRSASTGLTPLPSVPPSTATMALAPTATVTLTRPAPAHPSATTRAEPTEGPAETEPPRAEEPDTSTATMAVAACGNALPTRLRLDSYAYVDPDPPLPNNLRSEAGKDNTLIGEVPPGQAMQILEGPACVDGWTWWKVRTLETGLEGWTAEGDEQDYWLVPCASEEECRDQG